MTTKLALAVMVSFVATAASAQGFATTNVQGLVGGGFNDSLTGSDTADGTMVTVTLNHFSTWSHGDNFVFVDLARGDFEDQATARVYAEWHPRLSLTRLVGRSGPVLGIFRDVFVAGEVNQGHAFYAYLAGLGVDLELGGAASTGVSLFYRYDVFVGHTWQLSPFWNVPFALGPVPLVFGGFLDVSGAEQNRRVDVLAQPQLLVDVLAPFGGPASRVLVGVEWYLHYNEAITPRSLVSAPQAVLQWTWHP